MTAVTICLLLFLDLQTASLHDYTLLVMHRWFQRYNFDTSNVFNVMWNGDTLNISQIAFVLYETGFRIYLKDLTDCRFVATDRTLINRVKEEHAMSQKGVKRIGILLVGFDNANIPALQFLVLRMNSLQQAFEFEFLPFDTNDAVIKKLLSSDQLDREQIRGNIPEFTERQSIFLQDRISNYRLKESPPNYFILLTLARFSDNYYTMRKDQVSIIALGDWERSMAPPSILEFILTLVLREAVASVAKSLRGSIHLGTKGCLFDFTASLKDVRNKVLNGFICEHCCAALGSDGYSHLPQDLVPILGKEWLGESNDSNSPAGISLKLGYDLFTTKGAKATAWEKLLATIQKEGINQLIKIVGGIILAVLLLWLGIR